MPGKYIVKVEGLDYEMIEDRETSKDALGNTYFVVEMKKEELLNIEIPMKRKRNISPDINPNKFGYLAS